MLRRKQIYRLCIWHRLQYFVQYKSDVSYDLTPIEYIDCMLCKGSMVQAPNWSELHRPDAMKVYSAEKKQKVW